MEIDFFVNIVRHSTGAGELASQVANIEPYGLSCRLLKMSEKTRRVREECPHKTNVLYIFPGSFCDGCVVQVINCCAFARHYNGRVRCYQELGTKTDSLLNDRQ